MHRPDEQIMPLLAHSARKGAGQQEYSVHINSVEESAGSFARASSEYYTGDRDAFCTMVASAARYHDLGKVDIENQIVLRTNSLPHLPVPHEDAGVAALLKLNQKEAAILVAAHHAGLFCRKDEGEKRDPATNQVRLFRNIKERKINGSTFIPAQRTDTYCEEYLESHISVGLPEVSALTAQQLSLCGFTRRVALSCLVDADHSDTAQHYGNEVSQSSIPTRWAERLAALDTYVGKLKSQNVRDPLRKRAYQACRETETDTRIKSCDAPVGSGKTTAVMVHLLQAAIRYNLRHIIVVLPFTNIIQQSVETYRKALVLPGENPDDVIAEHHHRADFSSMESRQLATLWRAPIIVTTAVQFFETLASYHPSRLRKLHELPGSAVFVDEMHTAIPSPLWLQVWQWLETWTKEWGGYMVLASGSLPRFWQLPEFVPHTPQIPDILPDPLRKELIDAEGTRIKYETIANPFTPETLIEFVLSKPGPRLLIVNTVQSAAVLADALQRKGKSVLHLSTALAPSHRARIVKRVEERLKYAGTDQAPGFRDWTLVATSCVEAGMNFSFRNGFREQATTASMIQIGGRVNRGAENDVCTIYDFKLEGEFITANPSLEQPRKVLDSLFKSDKVNTLSPSELAKQAMQGELTEDGKTKADAIQKAESDLCYPEVSKLCRVIDTDTRFVVISKELAEYIQQNPNKPIASRTLLENSVQMWTSKIDKKQLPIVLIKGNADDPDAIYFWKAEYDPDFLGYMAGALPILKDILQADTTGVLIA